MIPIQYLVQHRVVALREDAPVHEAARLMCEKAVGCVIVTDSKDQLVGIVTDRDVSCLAVGRLRNPDTPLSQVMTPHPLSVDKNADIEQVVHMMEESGIRRIPVIEWTEDHGRKCIGLIAMDDLVASKRIDYDHCARIVRSQILRRTSLRRHRQVASSVYPIERKQRHPSLNRFYQAIQEETGLSGQDLEEVTLEILAAVVRRLQYTGAAHLIGLLPEGLHEKLLALPPGPDEAISFESVIDGLRERRRCSREDSELLLRSFFRALRTLITPPEFDALRLPFQASAEGPTSKNVA